MISVVILTLNSIRTLKNTLDSIVDFDEVIIIDAGSTDGTLELTKKYSNTRVVENAPFPGFGPQRQFAETQAKHDWLLALDSDEVITEALKKEIFEKKLSDQSVYAIPRHNFFGTKRIYHSSWSPDYCLRLYNRKTAGFNSALVHENVDLGSCKKDKLKAAIEHTPYLDISDFLVKMEKYTSYFADQNRSKKRVSFFTAISRGLWSFFRTYIIKRGILDGKEGFIISLYNAECAYYKYLKLYQLSKNTSMPT